MDVKTTVVGDFAVKSSDWQDEVKNLVMSSAEWFEIVSSSNKELRVAIRSNGSELKLKERSNAKMNLSADESHGPLGALFIVALGKKLAVDLYDEDLQLLKPTPFNATAKWLCGASYQTIASVAEALGLKPLGPRYRDGKRPPRLTL